MAITELRTDNFDGGLAVLCCIATFYRIPSNPQALRNELSIPAHANEADLARAALRLGLRARIVRDPDPRRMRAAPVPAIVRLRSGAYRLYTGMVKGARYRLVDPESGASRDAHEDEVRDLLDPLLILIQRRPLGAGSDPTASGFLWFFGSVKRYKLPLAHALVASLFIQLFALVTPLGFQVVMDKVLVHKGFATLLIVAVGLAGMGIFDVLLQYLRTYALAHTTSRIDVELGQRLMHHLVRLPLSYFESRPVGQTVARVRELDTIRAFLTGQGLFAAIDLVLTVVLFAVLFAYSTLLACIVLGSIPIYILIVAIVRPILRRRLKEKFSRGAETQQFLVETVVAVQTIKAAAVEPSVQAQWEERLAAYIRAAFMTTLAGAAGQNAIQYVSKLTTVLILYFGAVAVVDGSLTIGALVAFNMIAGQVAQPILRLSQLWQDFQQVQVSIERIGDILQTPMETSGHSQNVPAPPRGDIELRDVSFAYRPGGARILDAFSLKIRPCETLGIIGASGSGKSTIAKLIQRLYAPSHGQILLDGHDIAQVAPSWVRRHVGVVLQENVLFNRSIHDNIAFANPAMPRSRVVEAARLAGADEFIREFPQGYDTVIEERGANLSGGQRQRIAIARALVTNPRILIFDEATSALDYESEQLIQRNMRFIAKGRTVIIIAHRLATVRNCDRIIGLSHGRIVESGTHAELLKREHGLYATLWAMQFGAEVAV